ncbi:hypothetical protein DZF91_15165 [Actinomadura logoneensis]|uniref:Secreted protein n=1 Tax=Actinomadura logoneensis TaxID=2293572 RepID=A0A372JL98_9ACTN|nr:hypothetical protein [Actinomadura logoneensis]RFU40813.1 hypothetical protein DZF91_15165 [Actinomadura logoneensis]
MKRLFTRTAVAAGLGAALAAGPAVAAHADAAPGYTPSAADFKNCPAVPQGAQSWLWNCVAIVMTGGEMKLGGLTQKITTPITVPVAVGLHEWKLQIRTPDGGFRSDPIAIPKESAPLGLDGFQVRVQQAGAITLGKYVLPDSIPLKLKTEFTKLDLLGDKCYIGSDAQPIALTPNLSNLSLRNMNGTWVIPAKITDSAFSVPAATDCGLLTGVMNTLVGLPSASGRNRADIDVVIRVKNYAFGQVTDAFAKDRGITAGKVLPSLKSAKVPRSPIAS